MTNDMVIVLDVGNTSTKIGLAGPEATLAAASAPTTSVPTGATSAEGLRAAVQRLLADVGAGVAPGSAVVVSSIIVSSVVPLFDGVVRSMAEAMGVPALFVPADLPVPIENRYERPQEVGADRLVGAFAARRLHPKARRIVVVDFGTATTFDCVDGSAYLGGLICPGVLSSTRSLSEETAKLPRATLDIDPAGLRLGRSTLDSLNQGLVYGFAAMVEGLVARIGSVLGARGAQDDPYVLATGGFASRIREVCPAIHEVRANLLMEGLRLVWLDSERR